MMFLLTTCSHCLALNRTRRTHVGKKMLCSSCKRPFTICSNDGPGAPLEASGPRTFVREQDIPLEWRVGDTLLELYEIREVLGAGGFGRVYRVHHRQWGIDLAVKSPHPEVVDAVGGREKFIREADAWIHLGLHRHVVNCFYVRALGGIPRIFVEYVEGGTLKDWLDTRRLYEGDTTAQLERIVDIGIQLAWGLHYAHARGLVHQDVKPANVMRSPDGIVRLTDFGLARAGEALLETTFRAGQGRSSSRFQMTRSHCSPEQDRNAKRTEEGARREAREPITPATDVWSWGITLLDMFCGGISCPYGGQVAGAMLRAYRRREPDPELPVMSQEIADLLERCFQLEPEHRPVSLGEVATELIAYYRQLTGQSYARAEPRAAALDAGSLNNHALSLLDIGSPDRAMAFLRKALERDSMLLEAHYNQLLLQWRQGELGARELIARLRRRQYALPRERRGQVSILLAGVFLELGDRESFRTELEGLQPSKLEPTFRFQLEQLRASEERLPRAAGPLPIRPEHWVGMSVDGRWALSATGERIVCWDLATGCELSSYATPAAEHSGVPDGRRELEPEALLLPPLCRLPSGLGPDDVRDAPAFRGAGPASSLIGRDRPVLLPEQRILAFDRTWRAPAGLAFTEKPRRAARSFSLWELHGGTFQGRVAFTWPEPADGSSGEGAPIHVRTGHIGALLPAPDGSRVLAVDWTHGLMCFDTSSGVRLGAWAPDLPNLPWGAADQEVHWNGQLVVIGGEVFDALTGEQRWSFGEVGKTRGGAEISTRGWCVSPDGSWVAAATLTRETDGPGKGEWKVMVFDLRGTGSWEMPGVSLDRGRLWFEPEGRRLLWTNSSGLVIWDFLRAEVQSRPGLESLELSADGRRALVFRPSGIESWETLELLERVPPMPAAFAFCRSRVATEVADEQARFEALTTAAAVALEHGDHEKAIRQLQEARQLPGRFGDPAVRGLWQRLSLEARRTSIHLVRLSHALKLPVRLEEDGHDGGKTPARFQARWSPSGRLLALSASDGDLVLWDQEAGRLQNVVQGRGAGFAGFSIDDRGVVLGDVQGERFTLSVLRVDDLSSLPIGFGRVARGPGPLPVSSGIASMPPEGIDRLAREAGPLQRFLGSSNGSRVALVFPTEQLTWHPAGDEPARRLANPGFLRSRSETGLQLSENAGIVEPQTKRLWDAGVPADVRLEVWEVPTGETRYNVPPFFQAEVSTVHLGTCGAWLLTHSEGTLSRWDLRAWDQAMKQEPRAKRQFIPHIPRWQPNISLRSIHFVSREAKWAVVGDDGGHLHLLDLVFRRRWLLNGFVGEPRAVHFRPDDRGVVVVAPREVICWSLGEFTGPLEPRARAPLTACSICADGQLLAVKEGEGLSFYLARDLSRLPIELGHRGELLHVEVSRRWDRVIVSSPDEMSCYTAERSDGKDPSTGPWRRRSWPAPRGGRAAGYLAEGHDGVLLVEQAAPVQVWELETGRCLRWLAVPDIAPSHERPSLPLAGSRGEASLLALLELSPDGTQVLVAWEHNRHVLQLLEVATGTTRLSLSRAEGFSAAAFAGRTRLVTAGGQGMLRVWDLESGECVQVLVCSQSARTLALTADGRWAALGDDEGRIELWDLESGQCAQAIEAHDARVAALAFSPDSRTLVSVSTDRTARIWEIEWMLEPPGEQPWDERARPWLDAFLELHSRANAEIRDIRVLSEETLQRLLKRPGPPLYGHDDVERLLERLRMAGLAGVNRNKLWWKLKFLEMERLRKRDGTLAPEQPPDEFAASREGRPREAPAPETVSAPGEEASTSTPSLDALSEMLHGGTREVPAPESAAESAVSASVARPAVSVAQPQAGPSPDMRSRTRAWRASIQLERRLGPIDLPVHELVLTPDQSALLMLEGGGRLSVWDPTVGECRQRLELPGALQMRVAEDGDRAFVLAEAAGRVGIYLWNLRSGALQPGPRLQMPRRPETFAVTPDSRWAFVEGGPEHLLMLDLVARRQRRIRLSPNAEALSPFEPRDPPLRHLEITPDARILVFCRGENPWVERLNLWTGETERLRTGCAVQALRLSDDGEMVLAACGDFIEVFCPQEVGAGSRMSSGPIEEQPAVGPALEEPAGDSRRFVVDVHGNITESTRRGQGGVSWPAGSSSLQRDHWMLPRHRGTVRGLAVTPDGSLAVSGDEVGAIRFWDLRRHDDFHLPVTGGAIQTLALSVDGERVVSATADQTVQVWRIDPGALDHDTLTLDDLLGPTIRLFLRCHGPPEHGGPARGGKPVWTEEDFDRLRRRLQHLGQDVPPTILRRELERIAQQRPLSAETPGQRPAPAPARERQAAPTRSPRP